MKAKNKIKLRQLLEIIFYFSQNLTFHVLKILTKTIDQN